MTRKQCLEILELPDGASREEIIKAYRQLALVWHPDRFSSNPELQRKAQAKLAQINEAYSALIEGKATAGTPDGGGTNGHQPDPITTYLDSEVRYIGHDPRLKLPSGNEGVSTVVELGGDGLTVVTFAANTADEAMWYPESLLLAIEEGRNRWGRSGSPSMWQTRYPELISPDVIRLHFSDPEEILDHSIVVSLKFRNAYYAQLFLKRVQAIILFEKWMPPPPPPEPPPDFIHDPMAMGFLIAFGIIGVVLFGAFISDATTPRYTQTTPPPTQQKQPLDPTLTGPNRIPLTQLEAPPKPAHPLVGRWESPDGVKIEVFPYMESPAKITLLHSNDLTSGSGHFNLVGDKITGVMHGTVRNRHLQRYSTFSGTLVSENEFTVSESYSDTIPDLPHMNIRRGTQRISFTRQKSAIDPNMHHEQ